MIRKNNNSIQLTSGAVKLQYVNDTKREQARELRQQSTPAEKVLWQNLRNRKCNGLKFRRQQIIEGFIVDFYCEKLKLVIEVDGNIHDNEEQKKTDHIKNEVVKSRGLTMLRLRNEEVLNNIDSCLRKIIDLTPSPSPKREGSKKRHWFS